MTEGKSNYELTLAEVEALEKVVEYLHKDEQKDFEESRVFGVYPANHIFRHIKILKEFLDNLY